MAKKKGSKGQMPKGKPFPGEKAQPSYGELPGKGQWPKGKGGKKH